MSEIREPDDPGGVAGLDGVADGAVDGLVEQKPAEGVASPPGRVLADGGGHPSLASTGGSPDRGVRSGWTRFITIQGLVSLGLVVFLSYQLSVIVGSMPELFSGFSIISQVLVPVACMAFHFALLVRVDACESVKRAKEKRELLELRLHGERSSLDRALVPSGPDGRTYSKEHLDGIRAKIFRLERERVEAIARERNAKQIHAGLCGYTAGAKKWLRGLGFFGQVLGFLGAHRRRMGMVIGFIGLAWGAVVLVFVSSAHVEASIEREVWVLHHGTDASALSRSEITTGRYLELREENPELASRYVPDSRTVEFTTLYPIWFFEPEGMREARELRGTAGDPISPAEYLKDEPYEIERFLDDDYKMHLNALKLTIGACFVLLALLATAAVTLTYSRGEAVGELAERPFEGLFDSLSGR